MGHICEVAFPEMNIPNIIFCLLFPFCMKVQKESVCMLRSYVGE